MKSEPTEKTKGKKMAVLQTADRKNGRSPGAGHDEWWGKTHDGTRFGKPHRMRNRSFHPGADPEEVRGSGKKGHPTGTGKTP